mmetsp:Transcript_17715/g.43968  ORF Transcript_17715/g.43968 Transcript_17715/m.43968 type:complete len:243 (-) Transcript_17715:129-857(-)
MSEKKDELFAALHGGDEMRVRRLIRDLKEVGYDFSSADADCRTAMHWAAVYGLETAFKELANETEKFDAADESGVTPLMSAASAGRLFAVKYLLEKGADSTKHDKIQKFTSLHYAASKGHVDVLDLLLKSGGNDLVHKRTASSETPLHLACAKAHTKVIELLLEKGAQVNVQNHEGDTPSHLAAEVSKQDNDDLPFFTIARNLNWDPDVVNDAGKRSYEIVSEPVAKTARDLWKASRGEQEE